MAPDQGEPVSGGSLKLGYSSEPPTMDPRVSGATIAWRLFYNIFDPLVVQDVETGDFLHGLATDWEISEDGLIYTFSLKAADLSASTYTIDATPKGQQLARDTKCATLSINQTGKKMTSNTGTNASECW